MGKNFDLEKIEAMFKKWLDMSPEKNCRDAFISGYKAAVDFKQKCPVCDGCGSVPAQVGQEFSDTEKAKCRTCNGRGIV